MLLFRFQTTKLIVHYNKTQFQNIKQSIYQMKNNQQRKFILYFILYLLFIHINGKNKLNLQKIDQKSIISARKENLLNSQQKNNNQTVKPLQQIFIVQKQSQLHAQLSNKDDPAYSLEFQKKLSSVPIIKYGEIPRKKLTYISKGWFSKVYLWQQKNLIVKIERKAKMKVAIRQLRNLVIVNQIYPNFLRYIIVSQMKMVGFILQRAIGQTSKILNLQQDNVFHYNMTAKLHLISLIRQEVRKMQNFNLVHADIFPRNFIVNQKDKNDFNVTIKPIDFGNSYVFSPDKLVNIRIMVRVRPPQYRPNNKFYNASGVNAYQFGMCSLMILMNRDVPKSLKPPNNREKAFVQLRQKGLTENQVKYFKALFHKDIDIRNAALFSQPDEFVKKFSSRLQQQQQRQNKNLQSNQIKQQDCESLLNQQ